jgi:hypothetical protein
MSTTTNLALNEPAYNSTSPTWDQPLNNNATILDAIFGNTTSIALTNSNVTLTSPSSSGGGNTQAMRIKFTGAISANIIVTVPAIGGFWIFTNATSGAYTVTIASAGGANSVIAPQGYSVFLYSDGSGIYPADNGLLNSLTSLALTGNFSVGGSSTFNGASAFNATATLSGSSSTLAAVLQNAAEPVTIVGSGATSTINFDVLTQSILFYSASATGNFTINVRGNGSNTFNSVASTNQVVTIAFLAAQGSTPYYASAFQIDSTVVTPKWQGGSAPSSGNASGIDVYTYTIIKTGSATYTVLASQTQFA